MAKSKRTSRMDFNAEARAVSRFFRAGERSVIAAAGLGDTVRWQIAHQMPDYTILTVDTSDPLTSEYVLILVADDPWLN